MAMNILLPFASTYLCESEFSALLYIKSKYRTRLTAVENDLRISLSNITPRFDELCSRKQEQKSHYARKNQLKYFLITFNHSFIVYHFNFLDLKTFTATFSFNTCNKCNNMFLKKNISYINLCTLSILNKKNYY